MLFILPIQVVLKFTSKFVSRLLRVPSFLYRADSPLILYNFLQEQFLSHPFLHNVVEKNCGLVVLQSFKGVIFCGSFRCDVL